MTAWKNSVLAITASLLCTALWAGRDSQGGFEVGQQRRYRHEGPRPGSVEPNAIDGERILWVLAHIEEQGRPLWIVEEQFTNDRKVTGRLYVSGDGLLEAVEIETDKGEKARLRYDPPVPYQPAGMSVGETITIPTTVRLDSADFALPSKTITERLPDETVVTPAGRFADCAHYKSMTTSTIDVKIAKIPITEERERWYHPAANGMVREIYRRGPVKFLGWSRPGYTATSTLAAIETQEPDSSGKPSGSIDPASRGRQDPNQPQPPSHGPRRMRSILVLCILALAAGGLFRARRSRKHADRAAQVPPEEEHS